MRKTEFRSRISLRLGVVVALTMAFATVAMQPAFATGAVDEVHYTFQGTTSIALDWRGRSNRRAVRPDHGVRPRPRPASAPGLDTDIVRRAVLADAVISDLTAGTTYHYSIGGGPTTHSTRRPIGDFRFDAIGDIGDTTHFSHLADTFSAISPQTSRHSC